VKSSDLLLALVGVTAAIGFAAPLFATAADFISANLLASADFIIISLAAFFSFSASGRKSCAYLNVLTV
jgi:hypothetical protein